MIQTILLIPAALTLFLIWRKIASIDRAFGWIVGLGLAARAIAGTLLFWISWLDVLPRRMHIGDGHWFFAYDGFYYLRAAIAAAESGSAAMLDYPPAVPSRVYVQLLSAFVFLLGTSAAVAVFLNLIMFAAASWIIASFGANARKPALFALAALAVYPAGILWSTQPLKDPLVHCLFVVLVAAAACWQRVWEFEARRGWIATAVLGLWCSIYAISGSRWYFGLSVFLASGVLFALVSMRAKRRLLAVVASLLMFGVLSRAFLYGGGVYVPPYIKAALSPRKPDLVSAGRLAARNAETVRSRFDRVQAGTEIRLRDNASAPERLFAGLVAIVVPHFIIEQLNYIEIGGGRGLFFFADVDTIVFDIVAVAGSVMAFRELRSRRSWNSPPMWFALFAVMLVGPPLVYAVTNFGTLFRFRGMMYVPLALAPLAAAIGAGKTALAEEQPR